MAMTKAEVCCAFRTVMAADYADIPAKDSLEHTFSQEFYAKMDSLIVEQKRGSWRLLSAQARRALVAAIILALSLLLVACTPRLREAVTELVVTVYETFVRFTSNSADSQLRTEIEIIYDLNPVPEGFELVSQTQNNPYRVETVYMDCSGSSIVLYQFAPDLSFGAVDVEQTNSVSKNISGADVWIASADDMQTAMFFHDGYQFVVRYTGETIQFEVGCLVETLLSMN